MTDFSDPTTANVRLANSERDEAVARLNAGLREGRLSEAEFASRTSEVRTAVTRGDLATLFSDLPPDAPAPPGSSGHAGASAVPPTPAPYGAPGAFPPLGPGFSSYPPPDAGRGALGGRYGLIAVSISPFVALILFFITGAVFGWNYSWLWFILVPLTGAIVYGGARGRNRY